MNKENSFKPSVNFVKKAKKRVGRGNASGTGGECGRGHKGQKSRSGYKHRYGFEGGQMPLYKRIPKRRGIKNNPKLKFSILNLKQIELFFNDNDVVDRDTLLEKKLIKRNTRIKLLGEGELTKKVSIKVDALSQSAEEKLKKIEINYQIV